MYILRVCADGKQPLDIPYTTREHATLYSEYLYRNHKDKFKHTTIIGTDELWSVDLMIKEWDRTKTREYPQPPKDRFAILGVW